MAKITRLGLYGGPRSLYGTFAGKEASVPTQEITPTSIASAEAFGVPVITVGAVTISPTSIASAEAFGVPVITVGAVTISPTSIASAESVGSPVITQGAANILPTSIPSAESFGIPIITGGAIITSSVQFGKKFYANKSDAAKTKRKALSLQMRQEDEEILAIVQIIGKILL